MEGNNKQFIIKNWGLIDYKQAWEQQEVLVQELNTIKLANRDLPLEKHQATPNYLIFCEHPPVYTLGKTGDQGHLLASQQELQQKEISFFNTNRGGDITYHGPGQLVLYPILDLENFFRDVHRYLRLLEQAVIATLREFDLPSGILKGFTGVWIDSEKAAQARKICAIGIRLRRWITMHGLALNVNTDLSYFQHIIPCGIQDSHVTSMEAELGYQLSIEEVQNKLQGHVIQLLSISHPSLPK
jgi:lipoyl(octanoyl) transferase